MGPGRLRRPGLADPHRLFGAGEIAGRYLRREHSGHTLQPAALVHEAWLRLVKRDRPNFENRTRFVSLAAQIMRQILVDTRAATRSKPPWRKR